MSILRPRSAAERAFLTWAEGDGWIVLGRNRQWHTRLRHTASGVTVTAPSSFAGRYVRRMIVGQLRRALRDAGTARPGHPPATRTP